MRARRRVYVALLAVVAACAGAAVPASHAQLPACQPGTTNTLYCQVIGNQRGKAPIVKGVAPSASVCVARNSRVRLNLTITAPGGVARVVVLLDGHVIKRQTHGRLILSISPRGLAKGVHTITVRVVGRSGSRTTRKYHFRICKFPPLVPSFTG